MPVLELEPQRRRHLSDELVDAETVPADVAAGHAGARGRLPPANDAAFLEHVQVALYFFGVHAEARREVAFVELVQQPLMPRALPVALFPWPKPAADLEHEARQAPHVGRVRVLEWGFVDVRAR